MKKFEEFLEKKLIPLTNKFASIPCMIVLRNSMMALTALLVVGSLAAMLAKFPIDAVQEFFAPVKPWFSAINTATTGSMGLIAAIAVGYYGAIQYGTDIVPSMCISAASFLASQLTADGLNTGGLDSNGLLSALLIGFLTVKLMQFLKEKNIGTVAICNQERQGYSYIILSQSLNLRDYVKELNTSLNGKGGGKPDIIQGSFQANKEEIKNVLLKTFTNM